MESAKYVSRVGGLAIALGLGMSAATIPGVALADSSSGSSSSGSSSGSSSSGTSKSSTRESDNTSSRGTSSAATGSANDAKVDSSDNEPADDDSNDDIDTDTDTDTNDDPDTTTEPDGTDPPVDEEPDPAEEDEPEPVNDDTDSPAAEPTPARATDPTPAATAPTRRTKPPAQAATPAVTEAPTLSDSPATAPSGAVVAETSRSSAPSNTTVADAPDTLTAATAPATAVTTMVSEAPARALQTQPGTFISVATSMLATALAPFVTPGPAPAAPAPSPGLLAVLAWVRREIEATYQDVSVSIGGVSLVQRGTAVATSEGFGSLAIAWGANSTASATGLFSKAVVRGEFGSATADGGFNKARVRGDDSTATAAEGWFNVARAYGDENTVDVSDGNYSTARVRGAGNEVVSTGARNDATVYGDTNSVLLASENGRASAYLNGDNSSATAIAEDGTASIQLTGTASDAIAIAAGGSRASITMNADNGSSSASADNNSYARITMYGDGNVALADADMDGYASARIVGDDSRASTTASAGTALTRIVGDDTLATSSTSGGTATTRVVGDDNVAATSAVADEWARAAVYGDGNAAEATNGVAVINGDSNVATSIDSGSVVRIQGYDSAATADGGSTALSVGRANTVNAIGEDNYAFVLGAQSIATAGPGTDNTAIAIGNNLIADTGPGDGNIAFGQPINPDNNAPVAGAPGTPTVNPETGAVTGTMGFTDPDGDILAYTVNDGPANGAVTIDAVLGTYTYTPATRPEAGEPDGADAFTIVASDPDGLTASTTFDVPVAALPAPDNQAPVAGTPGTPVVNPETGAVTGTMGFTDPDGDPLTYTVTDQPDNGIVTVDNQAGTYTYTPATRPAFGEPDGTTTFTVTATDPDGLAATNTIGLPIVALPAPDNSAPVAGTPGTPAVDDETGVVTGTMGFTDPDGDPLTYEVTDPPANGSVTINAVLGTYTYTPATRPEAGEPDGADTFTIVASDPDGLTASTDFTVPVAALPAPDNQAPQAGQSGPWQINEETGVVTATLGFTDLDGDPLTYTVTDQPDNGIVTVDNQAGTYTYTPATRPAFGEPDETTTFTVTATDPDGLTATNTIGLPIVALPAPDNSAPVAGTPGTPTVDPETGIVTGTLGFTDPDGDTLTYTVTDEPDNGEVIINAVAGTYTYTPATRPEAGEPDGTATFTVLASDGELTASTTFEVPIAAEPGEPVEATLIDTIDVGDLPLGAAITGDGAYVYVTSALGDSITVIDTTTGTVETTIPVSNSSSIAITPDGTRAYVTTLGGVVSVVDTASNTVITTVDLDGSLNQIAVSPDGTRVYASRGDGAISVIDTSTNTESGSFGLNPVPENGIVFSPDSTRAYVADVFGVSVINTSTTEVITLIEAGSDSSGLAINGDGSRVYVTDLSDDTVNVIDTATNTVIATIPVGEGPDSIAVSPDGSRVYVPSSADGTVSVIDTASNTVVATVTAGEEGTLGAYALVISPDGERMYVTNINDGTLMVFALGSVTV